MKDVVGYEGLYHIDSDGNVWSERTKKFISPVQNNRGYWQVRLCLGGTCKSFLVHRLVAFAYIEPVEGKVFVNHKDSNKGNNSSGNLEWCTFRENIAHTVLNNSQAGKPKSGARARKLSDDAVISIRKEYEDGSTLASLSDKYSVSIGLLSGVVNRKRWTHV